MTELSLAQRVLAIHAALSDIPHAFGGAIALAYYAEPRGTVDIDLNLFVPVERYPDVAAPLTELGARADDPVAAELVERDGQARIMWDRTPLDLFFAYDAFHHAAAGAIRVVPFADAEIPILAPEHLLVCKAVFNRSKDWVDIEAMLLHDPGIDPAEVLRWVGRLAGDDDPRYDRVANLLIHR